MKRVLITGGLGLIGSHLARQFISSGGYQVYLVDIQRNFLPFSSRNDRDYERLKKRNELISGCELYSIDTRNSFEFGDLVRKIQPNYLIHLAALPLANISNDISEEASSTVINATLAILENIRRFSPATKFIYASSSMVYGNFTKPFIDEQHATDPISIYGSVKLAGEVLVKGFCLKNDLDYSIVRPSAVYGPTDVNRRVVQAFFDDAIDGKILQVNGKNSVLDFTYVEDIANGFFLAATVEASIGHEFNITSGDPQSIGNLADNICRFFPDVQIEYNEHEQGVPIRGGLINEKASKLIGYTPEYNFEDGFSKYVQMELSWYE